MIKIALVGYGKMGKEIEFILNADEFTLTGKYDIDNNIQSKLDGTPDVAIEFSTPSSMIENLEFLALKKINVVCGTTGWYDKIEQVKKIVEKSNIGFIYASNFSVGVNIYFNIIKNSGKLLSNFNQYKASVEETHHTQKLDKPSGTAIRICEYLKESMETENNFGIESKRIENVVGNHKVIFESNADKIILEHDAKSRRGFAEGALLAAKFIHNKKGFYKFEDIFLNLI